MIICSSCNSENPGNHRFCQQCGHPLQVWRAFLVPDSLEAADSEMPGSAAIATDTGPVAEMADGGRAGSFDATGEDQATYLDSDQRYQLQGPIPQAAGQSAVEIKVIDCHPLEASPIAETQAAWLQDPNQDVSHALRDSDIPAIALPYLALQADFFPIVPELHNAWTTDDSAIILIEDRSSWPLLGDCWQTEPDLLQRLSWLYEAALLWEALSEWQCQHTLLSLDCLRVDEDRILCLEYLSNWQTSPQPQLSDLGLAWQALSQLGAHTPLLSHLLDDLAGGNITDTETLKQRLAQVADQLAAPPSVAHLPADSTADLPMTAPPPEAARDLSPQLTNALDEQGLNSELPSASLQIPNFEDFPAPEAENTIDSTDPFRLEDLQGTEEDSEMVDPEAEESETIDSPTMVLPMKLVQVSEIGRTYVGRQRNHNEDCYCAQTNLQKRDSPQGEVLQAKGIYILCDGMGGHASGEVASELAVKTLMDFFGQHWQSELPTPEVIREGVATANQAIYKINQENSSLGSGRMGTTLVMVLLHNTQAVVAHVGDSRLYTYNRRLGLSQVTTDHEVGQREIQRGVEPAIAYARPDAYQLTQALGPRSQKDLKPDITYIDIAEDTLFLLCSDGLSDNELIERNCDTHIEPLLKSRTDLEEGVTKLIGLANEQNGHDNITAILVRVKLKPNMDRLPS